MKKTSLLLIVVLSLASTFCLASTNHIKFHSNPWCDPNYDPNLDATSGRQYCLEWKAIVRANYGAKMTGCYPVHNGTAYDMITVTAHVEPDAPVSMNAGCTAVLWTDAANPASSQQFDIHDFTNCDTDQCSANNVSVANMVGLNAYGVNRNESNMPLEIKPWS